MKKYRSMGIILEWQQKNRNRIKELNEKYRLKQHIISHKEWKACKDYFNFACAYCSMPEEDHKILFGQQLHKEHADANGSVFLDNCIPACLPCNSSKGEYELL
ncbi:HNH endonuclease [Paenibacillus oleatilyticus]|uniref:HNH endonuclease n=1 Tax=Paenibacillus oleatilyticus TaxID=2594886 RepID=UPI001C1F6AF1|nr:HNH endonuclease [Paenibacillus oleatilyticus]MBU7316086.1 HNH endonuclease [Paenibacillus oleatilyticus]